MDVLRGSAFNFKTNSSTPAQKTNGATSMSQTLNDSDKIMATINRYHQIYLKDPESKIFAPLAEAYRKAGQLEHAYAIAKKGLKDHPEFASGQVTFARILIDMNEKEKAISHLKLATEMSPDNFLAHKLLGETYIQLKKLAEALQVFKMALYLDPMDEFAKKMVKKLESLSAADFTDENILKNSSHTAPNTSLQNVSKNFKVMGHELDRYVSLIDAHVARNDYVRASSTLSEALDKLGKSPELQRRQIFLSQRFEDSSQKLSEIDTVANQHLKILNQLLERIENRRIY